MIAIDTNILIYAHQEELPQHQNAKQYLTQVSGNLMFDAQIAALCLEHGVSCLLTEDQDFARFSSIKTKRLP